MVIDGRDINLSWYKRLGVDEERIFLTRRLEDRGINMLRGWRPELGFVENSMQHFVLWRFVNLKRSGMGISGAL
jgi:hypothetical protein